MQVSFSKETYYICMQVGFMSAARAQALADVDLERQVCVCVCARGVCLARFLCPPLCPFLTVSPLCPFLSVTHSLYARSSLPFPHRCGSRYKSS